jgi:hypothetical protein
LEPGVNISDNSPIFLQGRVSHILMILVRIHPFWSWIYFSLYDCWNHALKGSLHQKKIISQEHVWTLRNPMASIKIFHYRGLSHSVCSANLEQCKFRRQQSEAKRDQTLPLKSKRLSGILIDAILFLGGCRSRRQNGEF